MYGTSNGGVQVVRDLLGEDPDIYAKCPNWFTMD